MVVIALVLTTACHVTERAVSSVRELHAVQQAVVHATGHTAVIDQAGATAAAWGVAMTNSPFASLPDDARRAKAQAIAQVAFDAYPPRASLRRCRSCS